MSSQSIHFSMTNSDGSTVVLTPLVTSHNPILNATPSSGSWVYYLLEYPGGTTGTTINVTASGLPTVAGVANAAYLCLIGSGGLGGRGAQYFEGNNNYYGLKPCVYYPYPISDSNSVPCLQDSSYLANGGNAGCGDIIISKVPYNFTNATALLQPQGVYQLSTVTMEYTTPIVISASFGWNGAGAGNAFSKYQNSWGTYITHPTDGTPGGAGGSYNGWGGARGAPGVGGANAANGSNGTYNPATYPATSLTFMDGLTGNVLVPSYYEYNGGNYNTTTGAYEGIRVSGGSDGLDAYYASSIMVYYQIA